MEGSAPTISGSREGVISPVPIPKGGRTRVTLAKGGDNSSESDNCLLAFLHF